MIQEQGKWNIKEYSAQWSADYCQQDSDRDSVSF